MTRGLSSKGLCVECTAPLILERPASGNYLDGWVDDQMERRRSSGLLINSSTAADIRAWAQVDEPVPTSKHPAPSVENFRPSTSPPLTDEGWRPPPASYIDRGISQLDVASVVTAVLLLGSIAFAALEAWSSFTWESRDAEFWDGLTTVEGLAWVMYLATGVAFIVWSYRAHANLDLFGREPLTHDHQATIWWWIVPVAFLWMPYKVIFETARGSKAPLHDPLWKSATLPPVVLWWTVSFLTGFFATRGASALLGQAETYEEIDSAITMNGFAYLLWGAAAAVAIAMIWQTSEAQRALAAAQSRFELTETGDEGPQSPEPHHGQPESPSALIATAGKTAGAKFCPSCGHEFAENHAFCANCGAQRTPL